MNLLFLSSDPISIPCLEALAQGEIEGVKVAGVVSNPDRRKGRGKRMQRNPVAELAEKFGIPVLQTPKLTASDLAEFVDFDTALVFAFGQILSRKILAMKPDRFLNLHTSPLPLLRGPSPIETAIALGWTETKVCLMRLVFAMDKGAVGGRETVIIERTDTGTSLREKMSKASVRLLSQIAPEKFPEISWQEQNHHEATYCRKLRKEDSLIDFSLTSEEIVNRSRAFLAWPGTSFCIGNETIRVADLEIEEPSGQPGQVLETKDRLIIATGDSSISIGQLQRPTRKMLPYASSQGSLPFRIGDRLSFTLSKPLVRKSHS